MIIIVDKLKNESCSIFAKVQYIVPICQLVNLPNSDLRDLKLDQNFFNVRKDNFDFNQMWKMKLTKNKEKICSRSSDIYFNKLDLMVFTETLMARLKK